MKPLHVKMQRSAFFSMLLTFKVCYQLQAASLLLLACEQRMVHTAPRSQLFLESSKYNMSLQRGMNISIGEKEFFATLLGRSSTKRPWQRPRRSSSAFLVGAIAAITYITFLVLSCFQSLVRSHGLSDSKRRLQNARPTWLCNVRSVLSWVAFVILS